MTTRVFFLNYHTDGEVLENELNELIETCEAKGFEVVDLDIEVVPIKMAGVVHGYHGNRYLVVLKGNERQAPGHAGLM
jgi:hypothetical protein